MRILIFCLIFSACDLTMNTGIPDRSERVRAYVDAVLVDHQAPGIQYLVIDSATTVFEYAGGWADIAGRVPMATTTSLMSYSMSKPITAAAVLQLVEGGRIRLDAPVDSYVPSNPYGPAITVRQLLSHTSGIPNPVPLRWVHLAGDHDGFDERSAMLEQLRNHPELAFTPGAKYRYSNIGYWLLGAVIERASGQPFTVYVGEQIFGRVGAGPTELGYRVTDRSRHANGYLERYSLLNLVKRLLIDRALIGEYQGRWLQIQPHYVNGPAFGGVVGNARGFGKFLQDQLRNQSAMFGNEAKALFYETQRTSHGQPVAMTLGWHTGRLDDVPFFYKEGGGGGFHAMMRIYPSAGVATVVLTNATGFDVKKFMGVVDREFID